MTNSEHHAQPEERKLIALKNAEARVLHGFPPEQMILYLASNARRISARILDRKTVTAVLMGANQ